MIRHTSKKTNINTVLGPNRMKDGVQPLKKKRTPSSLSDEDSTCVNDASDDCKELHQSKLASALKDTNRSHES